MPDRKGKKAYSCTFQYMAQLAKCCNGAANSAIFDFLDSQGFLKPGAPKVGKEETLEALRSVPGVPDWVKRSASQFFDQIDMAQLSETVEATRMKQIRKLLGQ